MPAYSEKSLKFKHISNQTRSKFIKVRSPVYSSVHRLCSRALERSATLERVRIALSARTTSHVAQHSTLAMEHALQAMAHPPRTHPVPTLLLVGRATSATCRMVGTGALLGPCCAASLSRRRRPPVLIISDGTSGGACQPHRSPSQ